ncbi:hypothetical protein [Lysobacter firmicutimachus]|uniref:Uncharacterized protein n=1 Tax=Lysobacter firmicutimachus TaxID=1792846 RepID=A0ABU8D5Z3_9GAMM
MKNIVTSIAFSTLALLGCSKQQALPTTGSPEITTELKETTSTAIGTVYFFGFDVPRITGIPEQEMEKYGCKFKIKESDLLAAMALSQPDPLPNYNALDVRAKISFPNGALYIDHQGVMSWDGKFSLIDKAKFSKALTEPEPCSQASI